MNNHGDGYAGKIRVDKKPRPARRSPTLFPSNQARRAALLLALASTAAAIKKPPPLFQVEIEPTDTAKTIPDTVASFLANKTGVPAAANKFNASYLASKLCSGVAGSASSGAAPSCTAPTDPAYTAGFDVATQTIIECTGVPLVSISTWAMGECGTRTTADPRIFGPPAWRAFHIFAQNYPAAPAATVKTACEAFVNAIPYMLPCPHCGYDFQQFIQANALYDGTFNPACKASVAYNMPCQSVPVACSSQANLVNFFLRAHYNVDTLTKPCKKLWTPSMAAAAYGQVTDFCANNIVYGTVQLCRTAGETGCVV